MSQNHIPREDSEANSSGAKAAQDLTSQRTLLIGTRRSQLATTQSGHVQAGITEQGWASELHIVQTPGDASQASQIPVARIGVGVFTETLRNALAAKECDVAVHSFKDLPTAPDKRFRIIVPERVDPREVLVSVDNRLLKDLPEGAKVGTSAPRRISQLRAVRPDLEILPLRGNIDSRMGRVGTDLDAVILARAGLERVGQLDRAAESLDPHVIMPAPAQGALAVEVRADDDEAWQAVLPLEHLPSHLMAAAERAVLATLEAGCSAPVAAHSEWTGSDHTELTVSAGVFGMDGTKQLVDTVKVTFPREFVNAESPQETKPDLDKREQLLARAFDAGSRLGTILLEAGASDLVAEAR